MAYDSAPDTIKHAHMVHQLIEIFNTQLRRAGSVHDMSKLFEPEKSAFDAWTPRLNETEYGSTDYQEALDGLKPALDNHYAENSHHPEHHENGIAGMTLVDLVEMFCDWKAASMRHADGNFLTSLAINETRFDLPEEVIEIFYNTAKEFGWDK